MALLKEVIYKGVVCNYHKIWEMRPVFASQVPNSGEYTSINIVVGLYKDEVVRENEVKAHLRLKEYRFVAGELNAPENEKIEKAYKALKKLPEFEGAEDV